MNDLCFCSAAFGSWGIVRLGSLVPECKMLFVCPYSCGRHNSIGAIKHGYKDRIGYLFIDEQDIALGTIDEDLLLAVRELVDSDNPPKVMLIYFSCVLYMSGFDWDAAIDALSEEYPEIEFRACMMNPIAGDSAEPPVPVMLRTLCSLWYAECERTNTANLLGSYSNLSEDCELSEVLKRCGIKALYHFTDFDKYHDYARMGGSSLNIVVRPEGLLAAKAWQDSAKHCFTPVSYDIEQIREQYEDIFSKLGARTDLSSFIQKAKEEIQKTLSVVGNRPIAVCSSAVCRPYSLARALIRYGFTVSDVFEDFCAEYERDARAELESMGTIAFHDIHNPACVDAVGKMGSCEIAIGYSAGYYSGVEHVVDLMMDEGMFGYGGICRLMRMIRDAAQSTSSVQVMIESYGLII